MFLAKINIKKLLNCLFASVEKSILDLRLYTFTSKKNTMEIFLQRKVVRTGKFRKQLGKPFILTIIQKVVSSLVQRMKAPQKEKT